MAIFWQRLLGTALGALVGAIAGMYPGPTLASFAIGIFLLAFQTGADAIEMAEDAQVGTSSLNISVRLITPKAMNTPCPEHAAISFAVRGSC